MDRMELRIKSMIWNIRKKKSIQSERQEEKNSKTKNKNKDRLRSLWDIFKSINVQIIGIPEGEEKE